jgi:hypothetical protein
MGTQGDAMRRTGIVDAGKVWVYIRT